MEKQDGVLYDGSECVYHQNLLSTLDSCVAVERQNHRGLFVRVAPSRGTTYWVIKQFEETESVIEREREINVRMETYSFDLRLHKFVISGEKKNFQCKKKLP
jgi:hypothetical protein